MSGQLLQLDTTPPPAGTRLVCQIVIGVGQAGDFQLEQRLPGGVPLDANNPAHLFGLFVVNNAQQLFVLAQQARQQAQAMQQRDEIIAKAALPA